MENTVWERLCYTVIGCVYCHYKHIFKKYLRIFERTRIPGECTAAQLIRGLHQEYKRVYPGNISILLGYINKNGEMKLLCKDQHTTKVKLESGDRLILFSNH